MPILDAAPLTREDEDALRGVLGPVARPPIHAEQMREAARQAGEFACASRKAGDRASGLLSAKMNSERAPDPLMRHLHSSA